MPLPPSYSLDAVRVRLLVIREIWKLIVAIFVVLYGYTDVVPWACIRGMV